MSEIAVNYPKKPVLAPFEPSTEEAHGFYDWKVGVELLCASVGWTDSLFGSNRPEAPADIDSRATAAQRAAHERQKGEYEEKVIRRLQLDADLMSALFLATKGSARDAIKFTKDPAVAWSTLIKKFQGQDLGALYLKLVDVVFDGMQKLGDDYTTKFKEALLELNNYRHFLKRDAVEEEMVCSLFVRGFKVPEYSAVKSLWTLRVEGAEVSFDELTKQVLKRRLELQTEGKQRVQEPKTYSTISPSGHLYYASGHPSRFKGQIEQFDPHYHSRKRTRDEGERSITPSTDSEASWDNWSQRKTQDYNRLRERHHSPSPTRTRYPHQEHQK
jgi:hypothetical protein